MPVYRVASSSYEGPYDVRCDGVDDDVQIQAAITTMAYMGGGRVELTDGYFNISDTIYMGTNVELYGQGGATIVRPSSVSIQNAIYFGSPINAKINNFIIDGNGTALTFSTTAIPIIIGNYFGIAENIAIQNYTFDGGTGKTFYGYHFMKSLLNCEQKGCSVTSSSGTTQVIWYETCASTINCTSHDNTYSGSGQIIVPFSSCDNLFGCIGYDNTSTSDTCVLESFDNCHGLSLCISSGNIQNGVNAGSVQWSFVACTNLHGCKSSANEANAPSGAQVSFNNCTHIIGCYTDGNLSSTGTRTGFLDSESMQQNHSSGDSTAYNNCFADAGTSYAVADTPDGGFNS